ncbi:hypothetical protein GOP47_0014278 [Adiantum capillus-veneris]|uniref:Uncharacterized protein n=1 Tax=Adiantum capillus-veneris TaxID=13818 RepID=A0A9D4ULB5_ADICA|nr:hypothetical protein GOP47_0014278 [Adiantum capillus-veneris]
MSTDGLGVSPIASIASMPLVGVPSVPSLVAKRGRPPKKKIVGRGQPRAIHAKEFFGKHVDATNLDASMFGTSFHAKVGARFFDDVGLVRNCDARVMDVNARRQNANSHDESSHDHKKGRTILKKWGPSQKNFVKKGRPMDVMQDGDDSGDKYASVGKEEECEDAFGGRRTCLVGFR